MTTNPNLESIGVSLIGNQWAPAESKYDLDIKRDEAKSNRIKTKELRLFNQPMVDATENTQMELKYALNKRDAEILKALKNCKNISPEEALHVPYAHYRYAA